MADNIYDDPDWRKPTKKYRDDLPWYSPWNLMGPMLSAADGYREHIKQAQIDRANARSKRGMDYNIVGQFESPEYTEPHFAGPYDKLYADPVTGERNPTYQRPDKPISLDRNATWDRDDEKELVTGGSKGKPSNTPLNQALPKGTAIASMAAPKPEELSDPEIESLKKQLDRWKKKDVSGFKGVDLSPMMALVDSWYGSNLAQTYNKPLNEEDKQEMIASLDHKLAKTKYDRLREKAALKRQEESAKAAREADLRKFKLQESGRDRRHRESLDNALEVARTRAQSKGKSYTDEFFNSRKQTYQEYGQSFGNFGDSDTGTSKKAMAETLMNGAKGAAQFLMANGIPEQEAVLRADGAAYAVSRGMAGENLNPMQIQKMILEQIKANDIAEKEARAKAEEEAMRMQRGAAY